MEPTEFSLGVLAPNGLRRGRTTGSCATAAVKAALHLLLANQQPAQMKVMLPDGAHYLIVPIQACRWIDDNTTRAEVLKDGGDDPDSTHGSTIFAEVRRNATNALCFKAGKGVGVATQPGLRVAVGEPAINPVPRLMMRQAVEDVLIETGAASNLGFLDNMGFDLTIGCEQGEEIAKKTFNPRLGIVGGISILGTSGIVEPLSLASWIASIEVYVRVALGGDAKSVAYLPGKIGRQFAKEVLGLPSQRAIQIANFLGEALDFTQQALAENNSRLEVLWLAGHPGKLAKVLDGVWDTHSSKSNMAMNAVANVAAECGFEAALVEEMRQANTVEAVMEQLKNEPRAQAFWIEIERRISQLAHSRVPLVDRVEVRLFNLNGDAIGQG
jgi:cobalt-precorrin-5B (C1)-methyltransferase